MLRLIRTVLFLPGPRISREQALRLAHCYAAEQGRLTGSPRVIEQLKSWMIWFDRDSKSSPWVQIDNQTGAVLKSGRPPK